mmetsp:Transcript_16543/g.45823  ORF Transcript_16543/g.45823 Transcript_16543/m.45823 type:complete len:113 (+) Transcript_16543:213-551(+)
MTRTTGDNHTLLQHKKWEESTSLECSVHRLTHLRLIPSLQGTLYMQPRHSIHHSSTKQQHNQQQQQHEITQHPHPQHPVPLWWHSGASIYPPYSALLDSFIFYASQFIWALT